MEGSDYLVGNGKQRVEGGYVGGGGYALTEWEKGDESRFYYKREIGFCFVLCFGLGVTLGQG